MNLVETETDWMDGKQPVVRDKPPRKPQKLIKAERALTPAQRIYLKCVVWTNSIHEANQKFRETGYDPDHSTLWRWRQSAKFKTALEHLYNHVCELHGISRESLIHRLEQIRDQAMTPTPILYRGKLTGFDEWQPTPALKAIETQAKLLGMYQEEKSNVSVDLKIDFGSYGDTIDGEVVEQD